MAISCCLTTKVQHHCHSCYRHLYRRNKKRTTSSLPKLLSSLVFMLFKGLSLLLGLIMNSIRFPTNLLLHHIPTQSKQRSFLISIFLELGSGTQRFADKIMSKMGSLLMTIPRRIMTIVNLVSAATKFVKDYLPNNPGESASNGGDQYDNLKETPKAIPAADGLIQENSIMVFLVTVIKFVKGIIESLAGKVWAAITDIFSKIPLQVLKLFQLISYIMTTILWILRQVLSGFQVLRVNAEIIFFLVKEKLIISTIHGFEALTRSMTRLPDQVISTVLDLRQQGKITINHIREIITVLCHHQIDTIVMSFWNARIALKSVFETMVLFFQYQKDQMSMYFQIGRTAMGNSFLGAKMVLESTRFAARSLCSNAVGICNDQVDNISMFLKTGRTAIGWFVDGLKISAVNSFMYCFEISAAFLKLWKEYIEFTKPATMFKFHQVLTWALKVSKESHLSWKQVAVFGFSLFLVFIGWSSRRRLKQFAIKIFPGGIKYWQPVSIRV